MSLSNKHALGQYMTTQSQYILQNLHIPINITTIIEPFAGKCDLIPFIETPGKYTIEMYDIEPQTPNVIQRDTILNPPIYTDKFVLTNPPYLARNKSHNKAAFDKYDVNDLYKCVLSEWIKTANRPIGGIIIIPLNFWSSIRIADIQLRRQLLEVYEIAKLNIFEEQVFDDTSATVCAFQFSLKQAPLNDNKHISINDIAITIYPTQLQMSVALTDANNYTIGGDIYQLLGNPVYSITRITRKNYSTIGLTNILVKCIDDNADNQIQLSMVEDENIYIDETPAQSARTYATLVIHPPIDKKRQCRLVADFNHLLSAYREQYHSLFLTNYRESKDIARKRISFDLVYQIVKHLL